MNMTIEYLQKADLESYKQLIDSCFGASEPLTTYQKNYQADSQAYKIVVAKEGDRIIGSVTFYSIDLFTFSFQPSLELFNVAVLEEFRKQKVAKKLCEFVIDYAKAKGYQSLNLTCLEEAQTAHCFYESLGFEKANSRKYNMFF